MRLVEILSNSYPEMLLSRYGNLDLTQDSYEILGEIAKKRGMVVKGGQGDTLRAATTLLQEFRNAKIGKITLERVSENA